MYRFLLVALNIDSILKEMTIGRRRKLEEMSRGNGLGDAYSATLARLKGQRRNKVEIGLKALMWVLYSERPLPAEDLCYALAVATESLEIWIRKTSLCSRHSYHLVWDLSRLRCLRPQSDRSTLRCGGISEVARRYSLVPIQQLLRFA